jgi:hypothetical protein
MPRKERLKKERMKELQQAAHSRVENDTNKSKISFNMCV